MKRIFTRTAFAMAMALASLSASAQKTYDFSGYMYDIPGFKPTEICGSFYGVSANGKYAVGYDDIYTPVSFIWNAENPTELELLEPIGPTISACAVTNDGVVYGSWEDENDGDATYPAYMTTDGVWHKLPVPENFSMAQAKNQTQMNEARAVSKDGKFVAGNMYIVVGQKWNSFYNKNVDVTALLPCIWEDGELKTVYDNLDIKNFMVWDISDDGSVIVGMNEANCGGSNPAIIKNGELINIINCDEGEEDEDGDIVPRTFNGGIASSIDADGNVYLYFQEDDPNSVGYYMYTKDGELQKMDNFYTHAVGEKKFSPSNTGLDGVLDVSEDGSVVVGNNTVSTGFGIGSAPALVVYPKTDAIESLSGTKGDVSVKVIGDAIAINGEYNNVEVYSATGALVASGAQSNTISLGNMAAGTYVVKVSTANGVQSFKLAK